MAPAALREGGEACKCVCHGLQCLFALPSLTTLSPSGEANTLSLPLIHFPFLILCHFLFLLLFSSPLLTFSFFLFFYPSPTATMHPHLGLLSVIVYFLSLASRVTASNFTFTYTQPIQCGNMTISWSGVCSLFIYQAKQKTDHCIL